MPATITQTPWIDRTGILFETAVFNRQFPQRSKERPVATVAGRKNAIKEVVSGPDSVQQITRLPHAHEVTGSIFGQKLGAEFRCSPEKTCALSYTDPSNRKPVEGKPYQLPGTLRAEIGEHASLEDAEQSLPLPLASRNGSLGPQESPPKSRLNFPSRRGVGRALVKHHHHIRTQHLLNGNRILGGEKMSASVQVRPEHHPLIGYAPEGLEAVNLKATAVRHHRTIPPHEGVDAADPLDNGCAWPKKQMVTVDQKSRDANLIELCGGKPLDGASRRNGKKRRRVHRPVGSGKDPQSGRGGHVFPGNLEGETHSARKASP
jgi:hypothetical protein